MNTNMCVVVWFGLVTSGGGGVVGRAEEGKSAQGFVVMFFTLAWVFLRGLCLIHVHCRLLSL